jgi:hypothetical protein
MKAAALKPPAKKRKAKQKPSSPNCYDEHQLAFAIAVCLETRSFKFLAKLLGELAPISPACSFWTRVLRLAADMFQENGPSWDGLRPSEGYSRHRLTATTRRGKKIIKAGLRAIECGEYTIAAIRKQLNDEQCPDFAIRDVLAGIGAPPFPSKRGRRPGSGDALTPWGCKRPRRN